MFVGLVWLFVVSLSGIVGDAALFARTSCSRLAYWTDFNCAILEINLQLSESAQISAQIMVATN